MPVLLLSANRLYGWNGHFSLLPETGTYCPFINLYLKQISLVLMRKLVHKLGQITGNLKLHISTIIYIPSCTIYADSALLGDH